jgi:hypothetical protein
MPRAVAGQPEVRIVEAGIEVHVAFEQLALRERVVEQIEHRLAVRGAHPADLHRRAV